MNGVELAAGQHMDSFVLRYLSSTIAAVASKESKSKAMTRPTIAQVAETPSTMFTALRYFLHTYTSICGTPLLN